ncbi:hypothetical protein [Nostoc phage A1]|nr:hypothetical protein [Nostoc phage A1]
MTKNYEVMTKIEESLEYLLMSVEALGDVEGDNRTLTSIYNQQIILLNALQSQLNIYKDAHENE